MDRDELIFNEYKTYCEQKENLIETLEQINSI